MISPEWQAIGEYNHRIMVTGPRDYDDTATVAETLSEYTGVVLLIHGAAPGLDTIAAWHGGDLGFHIVPFPAHWRHNDREYVKWWGHCPQGCREVEGRPAGQIRNKKMIHMGRPTICIAFAMDRSRGGTIGCVRSAERAGIPVVHRP